MTDPVPTRAHREMAYGCRVLHGGEPRAWVLAWIETGVDAAPGDFGKQLASIALALATIEHNARREAEPRWTLASAELPDSDVRVLVRGTDGDIVSAELEFTDDSEGHGEPYWAAGDSGDLSFCNYPHWMPLPKVP